MVGQPGPLSSVADIPGSAETAHSQPARRIAALDNARLAMAVMVVIGHAWILHDNAPKLDYYKFWAASLRIVIPTFLMISGYYFHIRIRRGISGWTRRTVMVFLAWSLLYAPFWIGTSGFSPERVLFYFTFGYYHLWYLPAFLGGGLILYVLRDLDTRRLLALAVVLAVLGFVIQTGMNAALDFGAVRYRAGLTVLPRNFLFYGFPYLAFGYLMARPGVLGAVRRWMTPGVALLIAGLYTAEVTGNYLLVGRDGILDIMLTNIIAGPLLFAWLLGRQGGRTAPWVAPMSAAIYFVHPAIIEVLEGGLHTGYVVTALAAVVLSFGAGAALMRANRYVPLF